MQKMLMYSELMRRILSHHFLCRNVHKYIPQLSVHYFIFTYSFDGHRSHANNFPTSWLPYNTPSFVGIGPAAFDAILKQYARFVNDFSYDSRISYCAPNSFCLSISYLCFHFDIYLIMFVLLGEVIHDVRDEYIIHELRLVS